jgi:hypothetical protein
MVEFSEDSFLTIIHNAGALRRDAFDTLPLGKIAIVHQNAARGIAARIGLGLDISDISEATLRAATNETMTSAEVMRRALGLWPEEQPKEPTAELINRMKDKSEGAKISHQERGGTVSYVIPCPDAVEAFKLTSALSNRYTAGQADKTMQILRAQNSVNIFNPIPSLGAILDAIIKEQPQAGVITAPFPRR